MSKTLKSLAIVFCLMAAISAEAKEKSAASGASRAPSALVSTESMHQPVVSDPSWYRYATKQPHALSVSSSDWGAQVGPIRLMKSTAGKDLGRLNK